MPAAPTAFPTRGACRRWKGCERQGYDGAAFHHHFLSFRNAAATSYHAVKRRFIPSPDAHILFLLIDWEKDASGRYEHKTLINLMKSSSPWLLPGEDGGAVAKGGT